LVGIKVYEIQKGNSQLSVIIRISQENMAHNDFTGCGPKSGVLGRTMHLEDFSTYFDVIGEQL
jgi:hypothetical protein